MLNLLQMIWQFFRRLTGLGGAVLKGDDVGFVCSVEKKKEMGDLIARFETGLGDKIKPVFADGKYDYKNDLKDLQKLAKDLIKGKKKALVATGGVVTLKAAVDISDVKNKVPILFLVGNDAGITHDNISGGMYLNMPSYNKDRVDAIRAAYLGGKKDPVVLFVNKNSAMAEEEIKLWNTKD
jgi:hypothetical protein